MEVINEIKSIREIFVPLLIVYCDENKNKFDHMITYSSKQIRPSLLGRGHIFYL